MKKIINLIVVSCLLSSTALAQNIKTSFIEPKDKVKLDYNEQDCLFKIDENYFEFDFTYRSQMVFFATLKNIKGEIKVIKYDNSFKKISSNKIINNGSDKFLNLHTAVTKINNKLLIAFAEYIEDNNDVLFYAGEIDLKTYEIINKKLLFKSSVKNEGAFKLLFSERKFSFKVETNSDKTTLTVAFASVFDKSIKCATVNENLEILGGKSTSVTSSRNYLIDHISIDSDNNKYIVTKSLEEKKTEQFTSIILININGLNKEFKIPKILNSTVINDLYFRHSQHKGKMYLLCDYKPSKEVYKFFEGVYIFTLSGIDENAIKKVFIPFSNELKSNIEKCEIEKKGELSYEKAEVLASNYSLFEYLRTPIRFNINELNDGTMLLTGNYMYKRLRTVYRNIGNSQISTPTVLHEIVSGPLIIGFLKDKECKFKVIPKYYGISNTNLITDIQHNKIRIIFNDCKKNIESSIESMKPHQLKSRNEAIIACAEFTNDGNFISKRVILDESKGDYDLNIGSLIFKESNKYFIPLLKSSEKVKQMLVLEFE